MRSVLRFYGKGEPVSGDSDEVGGRARDVVVIGRQCLTAWMKLTRARRGTAAVGRIGARGDATYLSHYSVHR